MKIRKRKIDTPYGKRKLLILQPKKMTGLTTGVLWLHGGGYATGMAEMALFTRARALVNKFGCVVIAPSYTLSWKKTYPAAAEDCYAALLYMKEHAAEFGIRSEQIMVGGESAGGGLTAAVCLMARDRGEVKIAFQMPLYPMIDDRDTDSSTDNHAPVWNTRRNHAAWKMYLKGIKGETPAYAAPARADDLQGMPPCYTFVSEEEPFYCETLDYVERLKKAGIPAKVDVYKGGCHAFDMMRPWKKISKIAIASFEKEFQNAKEKYFAAQEYLMKQ